MSTASKSIMKKHLPTQVHIDRNLQWHRASPRQHGLLVWRARGE